MVFSLTGTANTKRMVERFNREHSHRVGGDSERKSLLITPAFPIAKTKFSITEIHILPINNVIFAF